MPGESYLRQIRSLLCVHAMVFEHELTPLFVDLSSEGWHQTRIIVRSTVSTVPHQG